MPKRRARRKKPLKLKLKKKTVYTIFSLGFFLVGILIFIALIHQSDSTMVVNNWTKDKFGALAILFPFALFFFGFLFTRLKMYLSQVNVTVGYMLIFLSLLGLTKSGVIGQQIFSILQQIITTPGADLVFISGLLVGTIVFFDTSIDEIVEMLTHIGDTFNKLIPRKLFSLLKSDKSLLNKSKPLTIKGGQQKEDIIQPLKENPPPPLKKDQEILPDKLVSNLLSGTTSGVWEYPSPSLLSDDPGVKADRGDVNKIASTIERTLQSFGLDT